MQYRRMFPFVSMLVVLMIVLAACSPSAPADQADTPADTPAEEAGDTTTDETTDEPAATEDETTDEATDESAAGTEDETTDDPATAPTASDQPYRVGIFEDITTTNIWTLVGPDATTWNFYTNLPYRVSLYTIADVNLALIPQVAEGLPARPLEQEGEFFISEIAMKEGITWSDGTPLTANDVAFTANTVLELQIPGNWTSNIDANFLDRVEAVDDYTVKYYYKENPGLAVHEYNTLQTVIVSEAYWGPIVDQARESVGALEPLPEGASDEEAEAYQEELVEALNVLLAHEPDGEPLAGAFTFAGREVGAFVENTANPDYFRQDATIRVYDGGGYEEIKTGDGGYEVIVGETDGELLAEFSEGPFVSSAIYTLYSDQNAALLALQNGDIDFVLNPNGLQTGLVAQLQGQGIETVSNPSNGFRYLTFNARREPMGDVAFRQAVAVLIDKEFVSQQILQGTAIPLYSFIPEGNAFWYYDDVPKFGLDEEGNSLPREERVAQAITILQDAGYSWEGDVLPTWDEDNQQVLPGGTLIMPNGEPMPELEMLSPGPGYDPLRSTFAIWIEQWLNEIGIPVRANLTGFNVIIDQGINQQDFDMFILGWGLETFPDHVRDFFHSDRAGLGDQNSGGYSNPEFDELADGIKTCTDFEECREISIEIQQVLAEELPYVVLFSTQILEAYDSSVVAFPYTETLDGIQSGDLLYGLPENVILAE